MDLYEYKNLLLANHDMQKELWELKSETIPSFKEEVCDLLDRISQLEKALVIASIDKFYIQNYELEIITNPNDFRFAIPVNKKYLEGMGISEEYMLDVIAELKKQNDEEESKGDKE